MANIGGIMGLCMGCSLVTIFEVGHHVLLIFLKTGKKSVSRIQKTIKGPYLYHVRNGMGEGVPKKQMK